MNKEMNAMIDRAEKEKLWLRSLYQDMWFSPAELREQQAKGLFRWGVVNWELRDPKEHLAELQRIWVDAKKDYDEFAVKLMAS